MSTKNFAFGSRGIAISAVMSVMVAAGCAEGRQCRTVVLGYTSSTTYASTFTDPVAMPPTMSSSMSSSSSSTTCAFDRAALSINCERTTPAKMLPDGTQPPPGVYSFVTVWESIDTFVRSGSPIGRGTSRQSATSYPGVDGGNPCVLTSDNAYDQQGRLLSSTGSASPECMQGGTRRSISSVVYDEWEAQGRPIHGRVVSSSTCQTATRSTFDDSALTVETKSSSMEPCNSSYTTLSQYNSHGFSLSSVTDSISSTSTSHSINTNTIGTTQEVCTD